MGAIDNKYHIKIDNKGYILNKSSSARFMYQKNVSSQFVSKFGSGDSSYRDANFWQFWAQINWRNGAKQEKWGDGGRFWKSENVDVTQMEQLKLAPKTTSCGQVEASSKVNTMLAWRASQNWWNANYGYRQQLTITAPSGTTLATGTTIKIGIDTAALQTAGKLRSDRNDWRILFWNGSSWVDLTRDYVGTTETYFSLQSNINSGNSDNNYYVYYGYASESTSKQPTDDAGWNGVYMPKVEDSNVKALWHMYNGSGDTITDTDTAFDFTRSTGTAVWGTGGRYGRYIDLGSGELFLTNTTSDFNVGEFTIQWNMKVDSNNGDRSIFFLRQPGVSNGEKFQIKQDGQKFRFEKWVSGGSQQVISAYNIIPDFTNWYHYAVVFNGTTSAKIYRDGTLIEDVSFTSSGINSSDARLELGGGIDAKINHVRFDYLARTSFTPQSLSPISPTYGSETTTQPPTSSFELYAGTSTGKIKKWDGNTTWTLSHDASASINCSIVTSIGGNQVALFGIGAIASQTNGDAKIIKFDGSSWTTLKTFNTPTESQVLAMTEFSGKLYATVGPQARVYETSNLTDWTLSKDIDFPQKPGYPYCIKEYNTQLITAGGSPEFLSDKNYSGFSFLFNGTIWQSLYPFDHTVVRSMEFYDAFLFLGTYHGQIYTYNTSYLDPLFSFKDDYGYKVIIRSMKYFDDKLFLGLYPQDNSNETNVGVWVFDRHGLSQYAKIDGITGITSMEQVNNSLLIGTGDSGYVYKIDTLYNTTGWLQTSYFDANLPSIPKLWNQVEINHEPLKAGQSISLDYKFKDEDNWTNVPVTSQTTGDTSSKFVLPNSISSKKITFKITLNTTDTTDTPKIKEFIARYTLMPETKYTWNLGIICKNNLTLADRSKDTRDGQDLKDELEALLSDTSLHTFTDIDGSTHTVLFHKLDESSWVINQANGSEVSVPITLIEV